MVASSFEKHFYTNNRKGDFNNARLLYTTYALLLLQEEVFFVMQTTQVFKNCLCLMQSSFRNASRISWQKTIIYSKIKKTT